jgi:type IX secretion system PorP/SprF family membrane protein
MRYALICLVCLCAFTQVLRAQDPFFSHFFLNESAYNPALTGFRGATSVMAKYKTQWFAGGVPGFQTASVAFEESLPCSVFDYGLAFRGDEEGQGLLRTIDLTGRVAGTVAWDIGYSSHNLRAGIGLGWASKGIDYTRLIFSDELDPKYGTVDATGIDLPTAFAPLNDGRSLWFFSPAVGLSHRVLFNRQNRRSPTVHYGAALHHAFSLGNREYFGNIESILGAETRIDARWNLFFSGEFILVSDGRSFLSFQPMMRYQRQGVLSYYEVGSRFGMNRDLSLGIHYHAASGRYGLARDNNWLTLEGQLGGIVMKDRRVDLGIAYATNLTGQRNHFGPILEFSLAFHFASSPTCALAGYKDEVPYGSGIKCPTSALTPGRRKMYESIWYKNER